MRDVRCRIIWKLIYYIKDSLDLVLNILSSLNTTWKRCRQHLGQKWFYFENKCGSNVYNLFSFTVVHWPSFSSLGLVWTGGAGSAWRSGVELADARVKDSLSQSACSTMLESFYPRNESSQRNQSREEYRTLRFCSWHIQTSRFHHRHHRSVRLL